MICIMAEGDIEPQVNDSLQNCWLELARPWQSFHQLFRGVGVYGNEL
jgi:hypothetical protein